MSLSKKILTSITPTDIADTSFVLLKGFGVKGRVHSIMSELVKEYVPDSKTRKSLLGHGIAAGIPLQITQDIAHKFNLTPSEVCIAEEFSVLVTILWSNLDVVIDAVDVDSQSAIQLVTHYENIIRNGTSSIYTARSPKLVELEYIAHRLCTLIGRSQYKDQIYFLFHVLAKRVIEQKTKNPSKAYLPNSVSQLDIDSMNFPRELENWLYLSYEAGGISVVLSIMGGVGLFRFDNELYQKIFADALFSGGVLQFWDDWCDADKDQKKGQITFVTLNGKTRKLENWIHEKIRQSDQEFMQSIGESSLTARKAYRVFFSLTKRISSD